MDLAPQIGFRSGASALLAAVILLAGAEHLSARPTPEDYRAVGVEVPAGATLPDASVMDERGEPHELRTLITGPTVLVFADYTCRTLCGPAVAFVAAALEQTGLRAGEQFRLITISLNPKDTPASAGAMRQQHLGDTLAFADASWFLTAEQSAVQAMTTALGYRYRYDAGDEQFIHPAAAFVLDPSGRVVRALDGIALSGEDMRLALVEASEGRIGTFRDRLRIVCSAFDPVHGGYNLLVSRLLLAATAAGVVLLGAFIGLLILMDRRRWVA